MTEDRLYFRQLLAGRDFARRRSIAQQMVNFVYLVGDRETGEAVAIDPAYGVRELVDIIAADGMRLTDVLVTHYHPDHVGGDLGGWSIEGLAELLALPGVNVKVHVQAEEAFGVKRVTGASDSDLVLHASGDIVHAGAVPITLIHTPGHTPGSQCFFVDGRLVAGDTLFLDGCGRTDLPGGDPARSTRASRRSSRSSPTTRSSTPATCTRPRRRRRWATCAGQLRVPAALASSGWRCSATTASEPLALAAELAALDFCYVTSTGRATGRPHRIEIWFAATPDAATRSTCSGGRERADWVRNLVASPRCTVEIGDDASSATAA